MVTSTLRSLPDPLCSLYLSLSLHVRPNMANTVNAALKPFETLSRIVNQPSSLFGSKSASRKSKSEQDAQGASQGANSITQDPGRRAGELGCGDRWHTHLCVSHTYGNAFQTGPLSVGRFLSQAITSPAPSKTPERATQGRLLCSRGLRFAAAAFPSAGPCLH